VTPPQAGAQPVATSTTPGRPTASAPAGTTIPASTRPSGTTTSPAVPGTTRPAAGVQPVNNTSTTPGFIGTAPSNSTTANAGLGQSGVSGNATLGGAFSMTTPTFMIPIGGRPAPGSTQTPASGSPTPSPAPGSTTSLPAGTTQSTVPASTSPGTTTLPAGFAQGASNTTTTNGALDQFGLSGDALLSGLVNVNVQQLLASVQVQANLNVQDVIVNLSDILNDNQIQALVQALNTNPQAALNANDLSSALQSSGMLDPSQWVVGVTGSQIYANRSLTDALQSRGIIQPSETIMGTAHPHVFVVGPGGGQ
jgi:hypothetical protein